MCSLYLIVNDFTVDRLIIARERCLILNLVSKTDELAFEMRHSLLSSEGSVWLQSDITVHQPEGTIELSVTHSSMEQNGCL